MGLYHLLEFLLPLMVAAVASLPPRQLMTKPGCPKRCGNISIPYPFGLKQGCYHDDRFDIICTQPNKTVLRAINTSVLSISIDGELRVSVPVVSTCSNEENFVDYEFSPFTVSAKRNELTAVGCGTIGLALMGKNYQYVSGCFSYYNNTSEVRNGSCDGTGCCQSSIPARTKNFILGTSNLTGYTDVCNSSRCRYAFLAEEGTYNFASVDLRNPRDVKEFPVVLDWSIGNITCREAQKNRKTYACMENSECYDYDSSDKESGYRCNCSSGYGGNPYLSHGCGDINECEDPELNKCIIKSSCENTERNYTCSCPNGHHGDGKEDGHGCEADNQLRLIIVIGSCLGFLFLLLVVSWLYFGFKRRKIIKLREKYFLENGGSVLQQKLSEHEGTTTSIKATQIFTEKQLKKATHNYHGSRILGRGGQGIVYKGLLPENLTVAIKKSKLGDESQVEGFINEVIILSQINHRNVVKLLGCCLETRVPMLIYEFVTNGTLFYHLHIHDQFISWEARLKIATEVADALSYMHFAASVPIIHRDIKSSNILLDDKFTAKVSDFGASKFIPLDKSELTTLVQGTLGYLDPEYIQTNQLTEKSDVYSFGVVLAELLTRRKAISLEKEEGERNLAMHFVTSLKEQRLHEILDHQILSEQNIKQVEEVAKLAKSCLSVKGEERPTMKEVAIELQGLCSNEKHPLEKDDLGAEKEVGKLPFDNSSDISSSNTFEVHSTVKSVALEIGSGR